MTRVPDVAERERVLTPKHSGSGRAQWAALLAPLAAAYLQQQSAFGLVTWACTRNLRVLVHAPAVIALAVIAVVAWRQWLALAGAGSRMPDDERSSDGRTRFMASLSLTMCGFGALLVLALWIPAFMIHPCQR